MEYRTFCGHEVFPLGAGMMRLPLREGGQGGSHVAWGASDEAASIKMLRAAIDAGVNYVDTAYKYMGGDSERITGLALRDGYRERVLLATKSPVWLLDERSFESLLDEQLERLQTDHVDFYLLHSLNWRNWDFVKRHDAVESLLRAKREGKVRHAGFSFHASFELFQEILDATDEWDFCQIQLNYLDADYQAGVRGLRLAKERGLDVAIMEPLRGGLLALPPKPCRDALGDLAGMPAEADSGFAARTYAELAFDWLWDMPEVGVVLSGMGSAAQVEENAAYARRASVGVLSDRERAALDAARVAYQACALVPCTGCNYCREVCPNNVAIPYVLRSYNMLATEGEEAARAYFNVEVPKFGANADACVGCGACEARCPQDIRIADWMPKVEGALRTA